MAENFARLNLINVALDIENRRNLRRQRVIRDRSKAFELSDVNFRRLFRLEKNIVLELCEELSGPLAGQRCTILPVDCKVLIALRFYAIGSYQRCVGQDLFLGVSQSSVCRALKDVTVCISEVLAPKWIKFPTTEVERVAIKMRFMEKTNFPGTIGAIDCTHVAIVPPVKVNGRNREYLYVNRKGYHSINVQLICDYDLVILQANAKFPGSSHDTYIFKSSNISNYLEENFVNGTLKGSWLIGDAGYPLLPWLMIPISKPAENSPEERYSRCQQSARSVIERCNGVLKQRFRCLLKDRVLHYSPQKASEIIVACVVLHNICILRGVPADYNDLEPLEIDEYGLDDQVWEDDMPWEDVRAPRNDDWKIPGQQTRQQIIRRRFTH